MSGEKNITNRMGDVLLALGQAATADITPTKIQLQKFVYLVDVIGQVLGVLRLREGHKTYRNGPYDVAIQNAVDCLAFRGLVTISGTWRTPSGHLAVRYALAPEGRPLESAIRTSEAFARKSQVVAMVGVELKSIGWGRIVQLVYAEPTFVATRPFGWGAPLIAENGLNVSAAFLLSIMRRFADSLREDAATSAWLTDNFFGYLSSYAGRHANLD
jgi:hypothetical protein